jgi:hypothetical protein
MAETFAQNYVRLVLIRKNPATAAARAAGYRWPEKLGPRLLTRPLVRERIAELAASAWGREPASWSEAQPKRHYRLRRPPPPPITLTPEMLGLPGRAQPASGLPTEPQRASRSRAQRQHLDEVQRMLHSLPDTPEPEDGSELL